MENNALLRMGAYSHHRSNGHHKHSTVAAGAEHRPGSKADVASRDISRHGESVCSRVALHALIHARCSQPPLGVVFSNRFIAATMASAP
jgi:hypothetical protein